MNMRKAFESIKAGLSDALADTVNCRYPVQLHYNAYDAGWTSSFPDLPGCSAWGANEAEALAESHAAAADWLKACKAAGNPIPAPTPLADEADYSSRFVMRIPKRLHADLARSAKRMRETITGITRL